MKKDKESIKIMFDSIAPKYDFLNHTLSMGIDIGWRRKVVRKVTSDSPSTILDMATGTADLAIAMAEKNPKAHISGGDLSPEMLAIGEAKVLKKALQDKITLFECDALEIPFPENSFDVVTCAFGVRNFENLKAGLSEMYRVTKRGGKVYILEFSKPERGVISALYLFYFRRVLPLIGKLISRNSGAYHYLPDSVLSFPYGDDFIKILSSVGYKECEKKTVSFGIATIYEGEK